MYVVEVMNSNPEQPLEYSPLELLTWYCQAGVDIALSDEPVNQFEVVDVPKPVAARQQTSTAGQRSSGNPRPSQRPASVPAREIQANNGAEIPDVNAVKNATELASAAKTLEELKEAIKEFKGCNLRLSAKNMVFADGNPEAGIMFIGEAPDRDEDLHGLPFIGRSGQMLDKMLASIGLDREQAYLTNIIPWRPPGNRTPTAHEIEICRPFAERHIELAQPKLIVLLGGASKILLKERASIVKLRGKWKSIEIGEQNIDAISMFHPSNLVGHPEQKRRTWRDLISVMKKLQQV